MSTSEQIKHDNEPLNFADGLCLGASIVLLIVSAVLLWDFL